MKSKKMTKSTFAIIIMAIIMVAMLAFGGTYAYFTATAYTKSASVTTGTIRLQSGSKVEAVEKLVVYNDTVLDAIDYNAEDTNVASYIFVVVTSTITPNNKDTDPKVTMTDIFGSELAVIKKGDTDKDGIEDEGETHSVAWTPLSGDGYTAVANTVVYYQEYNPTLNAETGKYVDANFSGAFLNELKVVADPTWVEGTDIPQEMNVKVTVTVAGYAIQQSDTTSVVDAYNKLAAKLAKA